MAHLAISRAILLSIIHTGGSAAPEAAGAGSTTLDRSFEVVCD